MLLYIYQTFISVKLPPGVFIFTSYFPLTNPRQHLQRTGSQSPVTDQQVFNNKAKLPQSWWLHLYRSFSRAHILCTICWIQMEMVERVRNPSAEIKAQVTFHNMSVFVQSQTVCLLSRTSALLFILLPHSSHKVNCWDDLCLSKHLRDITSLATPSVWRELKYTHI